MQVNNRYSNVTALTGIRDPCLRVLCQWKEGFSIRGILYQNCSFVATEKYDWHMRIFRVVAIRRRVDEDRLNI